MRRSNYDKFPSVAVPASEGAAVVGWPAISRRLSDAVTALGRRRTIVVIECYPGVDEEAVLRELKRGLSPSHLAHARDAMLPPHRIDSLVERFVGGDDPVFGFMCDLELPQLFDAGRLREMRAAAELISSGTIVIVGCGAMLVAEPDLLVYADLARWEIQQRFRRKEIGNLGAHNKDLPAALKYKRAFFVDWRICDRWKKPLIARWDFVLDTNGESKLADGRAVRRGLEHAARRPFRVVPFFDPAPWGGQWMKEVCELDRSVANFGWCFDCVPEENSLLLGLGEVRIEIPSIDLVFAEPRTLLGEKVHARFGEEFPIRFDFLDTMRGGNLSLQVHPTTDYIRKTFGMAYTQDESYYLLDAGDDACVYLGLREGIDRARMIEELDAAQAGGEPFAADRYVNRLPARKHDHFLIPAGTVHCSGANAMVLEISATPYIFTFKLWDWGRMGLDGVPRPIHINHGRPVIQWERTAGWVRRNLVNRMEAVAAGDGWREERTGLHELEFIETRRHWFSGTVPHHTHGGVNVLNLVEGGEAIVESPTRQFEPLVVHYAETFIVPAAVEAYTIRPHGPSAGKRCATIKAFVRT